MTKVLRTKLFIYVVTSSFCFLGCNSPNQSNNMLETVLKKYEGHPAHRSVQDAAKRDLQLWINSGIEDTQVLKECTWELDQAVFFNSRKDRGYLLLLIQDNLPQAELDYTYVMYAAKEEDRWHIYFAGLPNLVFNRPALGKPIPMNELSAMAKAELSKHYFTGNGKVNDEFVNRAYTTELKENQSKFLIKKQHK